MYLTLLMKPQNWAGWCNDNSNSVPSSNFSWITGPSGSTFHLHCRYWDNILKWVMSTSFQSFIYLAFILWYLINSAIEMMSLYIFYESVIQNPINSASISENLGCVAYRKWAFGLRYYRQNQWKKRGMNVVPTKFGISYTLLMLNQSGALVLIYDDGSVLVSHGGTEMGQGLHTKMIQVSDGLRAWVLL